MLFIIATVSSLITVLYGSPINIPSQQVTLLETFDPQSPPVRVEDGRNVVTVPPNCPPGQEWFNGACRDVWRFWSSESSPLNVVTVPPNCPPGQEWFNGACRDVWALLSEESVPMNVVTVPPNCPPGQAWVNGECKDVWTSQSDEKIPKNVITVPPNCPPGEIFFNGRCRPVWFKKLQESIAEVLLVNSLKRGIVANESLQNVQQKNIISVPNQCPAGYKADGNGICRPIF